MQWELAASADCMSPRCRETMAGICAGLGIGNLQDSEVLQAMQLMGFCYLCGSQINPRCPLLLKGAPLCHNIKPDSSTLCPNIDGSKSLPGCNFYALLFEVPPRKGTTIFHLFPIHISREKCSKSDTNQNSYGMPTQWVVLNSPSHHAGQQLDLLM